MIYLLALFLLLAPFLAQGKEIAITFDDIPMPKSCLYDKKKRVDILLDVLEKEKVRAAFFCIGQYVLQPGGKECLEAIALKNHFLANHSFTHTSLSKQSVREFSEELQKTEEAIGCFAGSRKWYRFPNLDFGNREEIGGSEQKKEEVFALLKEQGYIHGYVTINTFDWYLNHYLLQALKNKQPIHWDLLEKVYLRLLAEWLDECEGVCSRVMPEQAAHVLLFHGNDINALFLPAILSFLRQEGWTFVDPEKAYASCPQLHFCTHGDLYVQQLGIPYTPMKTLTKEYVDDLVVASGAFEAQP